MGNRYTNDSRADDPHNIPCARVYFDPDPVDPEYPWLIDCHDCDGVEGGNLDEGSARAGAYHHLREQHGVSVWDCENDEFGMHVH